MNTKQELNEAEALNISIAISKYKNKNINYSQILSNEFLLKLHKDMYWEVWDGAGSYRKSNKNIWCSFNSIWVELQILFDDILYTIKNTN